MWLAVPIAAIMLTAACAPAAQAQVFKCSSPQGGTVYSDQPCERGQSGQMLLRQRTPAEALQEQAQAYTAQAAKEQRRALEQERELQAQQLQAMRALQAAQQAPPPAYPAHKGYAERLAERNAGVRSLFERPQTRAERGLPPIANPYQNPIPDPSPAGPPPPTVMTHCGGGFCHDNQGGVYHLHGSGTTMTGPGGSTCVQAGNMIHC